jgi:hypothetical protein
VLIQSLDGPCVEDDYGEESGPDDEPDDLLPSVWAGDICGACGQEFTTRKAYRDHLKQHHQPRFS